MYLEGSQTYFWQYWWNHSDISQITLTRQAKMLATACLLFSASLPMHCHVSSKCLFSLEWSWLEADIVKLEPFQKCGLLQKRIHPQKQKWVFLCKHNKIKVLCQLPFSFLNDCAVYRSAGLHQYLLAANNSLPCFWLSPAAQICKCMLLPIWKISSCMCTQ